MPRSGFLFEPSPTAHNVGIFGDVAMVLRRGPGFRNEWGEWKATSLCPPIQMTCSTVPATQTTGGRARVVDVAGQQVEAERVFYFSDPVYEAFDDRDGDLIQYADEIWRIINVNRWSGMLFEAETVRIIPQDTDLPTVGATALERNIRAHVARGSGLSLQSVIPANDHGPQPQELHCSVLVVEDIQRGQGGLTELGPVNSGGYSQRQDVDRRAQVSVQWWRAGAVEAANRFANWLDSQESLDSENGLGLRLQPPFKIRNVSNVLAGEMEARAAMDLVIDYGFRATRSVEGVEIVGLGVCMDNIQSSASITHQIPRVSFKAGKPEMSVEGKAIKE